ELRDDAFEAQPAGMLQHHIALLRKMLAEAQPVATGADDFLELALAFDQRQRTDVLAVDEQEIEGIEQESLSLAGAECCLECREIGTAALVLDHQFAVDDGILDRHSCKEFRNVA